MRKKVKTQTEWKSPRKLFFFFLICVLIIFVRYIYLALSPSVNGRNIQTFAANRNTVSKVLTAKRGTIYDAAGGVLAQNVTSYTIIAYLDKKRSTETQINHVKDIEATAKALAPLLNADENTLKEIMQKGKDNNRYQVEFGKYGKNITEITKSEIEKLNLKGIDFIESYKRYYPNGNFASYILGYAINK